MKTPLTKSQAWVLAHLLRYGPDYFLNTGDRCALTQLEKLGYIRFLNRKEYKAKSTEVGRARLLGNYHDKKLRKK